MNVGLVSLSRGRPNKTQHFAGVDVSDRKTPSQKDAALIEQPVDMIEQHRMLSEPDATISFAGASSLPLLKDFCAAYQGLCTSDDPQFIFEFWELPKVSADWKWLQSAAANRGLVGGASSMLLWEDGRGRYYEHAMRLKSVGRLGGWKSGASAWGRPGIAVNVTRNLFTNFYLSEFFDNTIAAIVPNSDGLLSPIFAFMGSEDYMAELRQRDPSLSVTEHTLLKVPFDLEHWQQVAAEEYPQRSRRSPHRTTRPNGSSRATRGARPTRSRSPWPGCSATAGRARPARNFPTARRSAGRAGSLRRQGRHRLPPRRCGASPPPPSGCSRSCGRLSARNGTAVLDHAADESRLRRARRSTTGSATASSSSTASGSTTARSSGTSGTVARTASPPGELPQARPQAALKP